MILTLEPTDRIGTVDGVPSRVWAGTTDSGVPIHAWIRCVSPQTHDEEVAALFQRELQALPPAWRKAEAYDLRFLS